MIKFPCKCGNVFNLSDDMAGGMLQCPHCGLLNDIPTLSDLPNLREDGTIKLAEPSISPEVHDEHAIAQMHIAFSRHTTDPLGREKDLRPDEEHFRAVGSSLEEPASVTPKYDPATGELIRPLDLKADDAATPPPDSDESVPLAVLPVEPILPAHSISYAMAGTRAGITPVSILLELFQPANAAVMFFVFLFYLIAGKAAQGLDVGSAFVPISLQILNIPVWLIMAHYGSVIEETGLEARDELPRPLRNLDFTQDLLGPFISVLTAGLICYLPAIIIDIPRIQLDDRTRLCLMLLFELIGSFFLPAVVMTTTTGATLLNLRPDRVLSIIMRCGGDYLLAVGVFMLSALPTAFYLLAPNTDWINPTMATHLQSAIVYMPVLAVCVYLMHYFCWLVGLMYRTHHDQFPWVLQRHVSTRHHTNMSPPPRRP
jgi:hypothetical protein